MKAFNLLLVFVFIIQESKGQINTPVPTVPLNSNTSYPFATILPTNAVAADATTAYTTWKSQYISSCGTTPAQYRVNFDDPIYTVSEGIGYGMLLAAYAGDKDLFDGLWTYYKASSNGNGLMNWKRNGCGPNQSNGATDADEDAAMALIVAEYQWPSLNSPYDYKAEANTLITNINRCEIDKNTTPQFQPASGDGWINCNSSSNNCRNPSYMAPAYYKCWSTSPYVTSPQPTCPWSTVVSTSQNLVNANVSSKGLVTNWSDQNGVTSSCAGPISEFGYDASRNPWRMATYSAWYGDVSAIAICNNIATSTQAAGPAVVGGPVSNTSNPTGTHNATFVSTLSCGTFGSTTGTQTHINAMYSEVLSTIDPGAGTANPSGYFGNTLRVISIFFATKNFWNPCNATTAPVKLINFSANTESKYVLLNWITATEINNQRFVVERSDDGYTFESIGTLNGAGNSNAVVSYSWPDHQPLDGISYYRLVQYDFDGTSEYSYVISLKRDPAISVNILPNPFSHLANISVSSSEQEKIQIKVRDLSGKILYASNEYFTNENIYIGEDLAAGMYIVQVVVNGNLYHKKMIKG